MTAARSDERQAVAAALIERRRGRHDGNGAVLFPCPSCGGEARYAIKAGRSHCLTCQADNRSTDELASLLGLAPLPIPNSPNGHTPDAATPAPSARLDICWMSEVTPKPIDWIWPRWLARGKVHLLAGVGGIGKGTIMASLATQFSTGTGTLPDGTPAPLVRSLFLLSEDAPDDTFWPRLDIHEADKRNVACLTAVIEPDGTSRLVSLAKHVALLEAAVAEHGIGLIVVDALSDFMPGADRNSEGEVRDILTPLADMARRSAVAIVGVMHPGKGNAELRAFQRILGASAFGNVARCVWLAVESPDGEGRNLLGVDKSNLAAKPPTLEWSRPPDAAIVWHGPSQHAIGDAFGASTAKPRDDAEGFLRELLAGGSVESERVLALAKSAGLSERTVRRAADELRVERYRPHGQRNPRWFWKLPNGPADRPGDELATALQTPVANSTSRADEPRVGQPLEMWPSREIPQNNGKMATGEACGQVVAVESDDLATGDDDGRLDDLATRESKGVANSSNGPADDGSVSSELEACPACAGDAGDDQRTQ